MKDKRLETLLRVSVELYSRSRAIKQYLQRIGPGPLQEHSQITISLNKALDGIENVVTKNITFVRSVIVKRPKDVQLRKKALRLLLDDLRKFSRWFVNIHQLLVHLPREPAARESGYMLKDSFRLQFDVQSPSIILGSLFNALEFDFLSEMSRRIPDLDEIILDDETNIVLQLPICDRDSPAGWAVLAHELGHAIDIEQRISEQVTPRFVKKPNTDVFKMVKSWCMEFCADLIAAKALGPSPMFALLSLENCVYPLRPVYQYTETHPPTRWRFEVTSNYLKSYYDGQDFFSQLREPFYNAWDYSIEMHTSSEEEANDVKTSDERLFDTLVRPLVEDITTEIEKTDIVKHVVTDASIKRCVSRLGNGLPIGAQGAAKEGLKAKIDEYLAKTVNKPNREGFYELARGFKEEALPVPAILLSAVLHRSNVIDEGLSEKSATTDIWSLSDTLARVDELVANSIRSSSVHTHISHRLQRG